MLLSFQGTRQGAFRQIQPNNIISSEIFVFSHFLTTYTIKGAIVKVLPFRIPKPEKEALVYQEDLESVFYDQLHKHEEIHISYVVKGSGSLIVGDTISNYSDDDILVIGGNVPHVFKSDTSSSRKSLMLSLFFTSTSFGKEFFKVSDLQGVEKIFDEAQYGLKVISNRHIFHSVFRRMKNETKIQRISSLLLILDLLGRSEKKSLSSFVYQKKYSDNDGKRMRAVIEYAMEKFDEPISLDVVAEKANMSKNAFCRYFKKRTNKTFFQFLIEIRIENACRLLYNKKELPVSSISEISGFQNIANFNRKFKELKGVTPSQYRLRLR